MNPGTLAVRLVARRRKLMLRSGILVGIASFTLVTSSAVILSARDQLAEIERTRLHGELESMIRATGSSLAAAPDPWFNPPPGTVVSRALVTPGTLRIGTEAVPAEIRFADVDDETRFADIQVTDGSPDRAVILPADTHDPGSTETRVADAVVSIPGLAPVTVTAVPGSAGSKAWPVVVLPWSMVPDDLLVSPAVWDHTRLRGESALDRTEVRALEESTGLAATRWMQNARTRVRDLWLIAAAVAALLFVAGGFLMSASHRIAVSRAESDLRLLPAMGYPRGYVRAVVAAAGAVTASVTAASGAIVSALVLSVIGLRGGVDGSMLPIYWQAVNPTLESLTTVPPLVPGLIATISGAVTGSLSALPSARLVDTMGAHHGSWN